MKVNNVSFGQTYLKPSIKNLSQENQEKLKYSYALGELYPVDLYLGGTPKGDLEVTVKGCSVMDYLVVNNALPLTQKNINYYLFTKACDGMYEKLHGPKYPKQKTVIDQLDYIPEDVLPFYIAAEIEEYTKKYAHLLYN